MIGFKYDWAEQSRIGHRKINQDRVALIESEQALCVVLGDGMGGHPKGEMAAQLLVDSAEQSLFGEQQPIAQPQRFLTRVLTRAHEQILAYGFGHEPPIDPRTTAVVALIQDGVAYWVHAGDSRLYLIRGGQLVTRTTDDSYVERLRQQGIITPEQRAGHPQRNYVTRCLGGSMANPEMTHGRHELQTGDLILVCSDGLWSQVSSGLISDACTAQGSLQESVDLLCEEAVQRGFPDSDNVTIGALRLGEVAKGAVAPCQPRTPQETQDPLSEAIAELQSAIEQFQQEQEKE